jgi:hypothetical protein
LGRDEEVDPAAFDTINRFVEMVDAKAKARDAKAKAWIREAKACIARRRAMRAGRLHW